MAKRKTRKNPTIQQIVDAYIEDCKFREIASVGSVESHFKPFLKRFAEMRIDDFNEGVKKRAKDYEQARLTEPQSNNRKKGVSKSTISREGRNWRAALKFAYRDEIVGAEQVKFWWIPQANKPRARVLSHEEGGELDRVTAALTHRRTPYHTALFTRIALFTGQRKTAILQLCREHIDFERGVIWFSRTQERETKKKRQDQPIHADLLPFLEDAVARMAPGCDHVVQFRGRPVKDVRTSVQALYRRAGVSGLVVHDLRRTVAQTVRDETDDLDKAARLIGDTPATTGSTYARPRVAANLPAMDIMARKMARTRTAPAI